MTARHPEALGLALAIYAGSLQRGAELDYTVHEVIEKLLSEWSDVQKADLYSRIVEGWAACERKFYVDLENIVNRALWKNLQEFCNG